MQSRRTTTVGLTAAAVVLGAGVLAAPSAASEPLPVAVPVAPTAAAQDACTTEPQDEYATSTPEAVGLDPVALRRALDHAALDGSSSIKVLRHGCLVGEGLRDGTQDRVPALNAGQTKAVVALAAGVMVRKGWLDLDDPVGVHLPEGIGDAEHRTVTLRQMMNLVSGVRVNHVNGLNFFGDQSRVREYFATPLEHDPGTYYEFDEITPSVVVEVMQQVLDDRRPGTDFQDFVQDEVFDPLGIPRTAYFWQKDRSGTTTGYSGLWLRPLEYGRLGQLLLDDGAFAGRQVLDPGFVDEMRTGTAANCGFGLYVWLNSCRPGQTQVNTDYPSRRTHPGEPWIESAPADMYYSLGLGTNTFVIPSLDMVVTRDGYQELDLVPGLLNADIHGAFPGNAGGPGDHELFRLLMAAVTDMPDEVRATIANSGPYDRPADRRVDLAPFIDPPTQALGTYLVLGPDAPTGCTALSCSGAENDGLGWLMQVPRTLPGLVGAEQRPAG